jgi:hypothetical protein
MSKRINDQTPPKLNGSLRVRWVEVELNGADSTIEEALRAVERMRRPVIDSPPTPKRVAQMGVPANGDHATAHPHPLFENQEKVEANGASTELASDAGDITVEAEPPRKKRGGGDRKDRNAGIKPVGDIDFVPSGKQSLKEFFAAKGPASDIDQVLVLCHFLQHSTQSTSIGPGHILGGFKHVNKPVPKDLKQTIRNMKEKKAWISFTDIENIRVTTEGDNRVEHELGKVNGDVGVK